MTRRAVFTATVLFVACGLCGPAPAQAQEAPLSTPTSSIADSLSGTAAIRAVEAKMAAGVLHRDLEVLRQLWAEDFMVNAPRNVVVPTRAAVLEVFRKGIPNYSVFDTDIEEIRLRDGVATVMGRETVKPVGEAPYAGKTVQRRYTHVWRMQDGRWHLFVRHAHIVSIE